MKRLEYCGHLVNLRSTTLDFKTGRTEKKPQEEWHIFENRHEPIISEEVFNTVQKLRETPRRIDKIGTANPLTGLLWCSDCGQKLYNYRRSEPRTAGEKKIIDVYNCSTYKIGKKDFKSKEETCTVHHLSTENARKIILDVLRKTSAYVNAHENEFLEKVRASLTIKQTDIITSHKKTISKNEKRLAELSKIFNALYEDKVLGRISEERFAEMTGNYEQELSVLKKENIKLQAIVDKADTDTDNTEKFLTLIRKYTNFDELTTPMINEFVDKLIVHEAEWSEGFNERGRPMGVRTQQVDVYLKYIGNFEVPDMRTAEEIKAERIVAEKLEAKRKYDREVMRRHAERKRAAKSAPPPEIVPPIIKKPKAPSQKKKSTKAVSA